MTQSKGYILDDQLALFGKPDAIGFGNNSFCVKEINKGIANEAIIKNHYSKKVYAATYIHLGVFIDDKMLGVLQYGYAMNPASCDSVVAHTAIDEYLELNRMWLSDEAKRNSESRAISYSIKYIKRKYPKIRWIQSFADQRCNCFGIVYQAANFSYYGEHDNVFYEVDGEVFHKSRVAFDQSAIDKNKRYIPLEKANRATKSIFRQFRYLYFIKQKYKKDCRHKEKPYPKHYNGD